MCCQLEAVFEDTHTHRCIVMPSVGQPHQTHSWIPGWLWHDALNLSTSHRFTTHITYPGWQDPDKSQNPIPPTSPGGEGASPPRETTHVQKLRGIKGRKVGGSHQGAVLRDPWQPHLWPSCAEMPLHSCWRWKIHMQDTHLYPKRHFPSALTSDWLRLWQGGRLLQPALSTGKLAAFWPSQKHHGGTRWSYVQPDRGQQGPHRHTGLSQRPYSTLVE